MTRSFPPDAVAVARQAQEAFRRAAWRFHGARGRREREAAFEAFRAAREHLRRVPARLLAEARAEEEAGHFAVRYEGSNRAGAERLRKWIRE